MADITNLKASVERLIVDVKASFDSAVAKAVADAEAGLQAGIDALQAEVDAADADVTSPAPTPVPDDSV